MRRIKIFFLLLVFLTGYFVWKFYSLAKYFSQKERLSVLIYDSQPVFLSLDLREGINYYSYLPLDFKIDVPGGYGSYRIGSIGKLAFLEKDPELLKRSFSLLFATPLDYYFYSDLSKIYYNNKELDEDRRREKVFFSLKKFFVYKTNASFAEKVFIFSKFLTVPPVSFQPIRVRSEEVEEEKISLKKFHRRIQGSFYNRKIREENKRVKIYYNKEFSAAENLAAVFEGMGIDVLGFERKEGREGCIISTKKEGTVERIVSRVFGCQLDYDEKLEEDLINFYLGKKLEQKWR